MVLAALKDEGYIESVGETQAFQATIQQNIQQGYQQKQQQPSSAPSFANTISSGDNSARFLEARDNMTREIMQLLGKDAEMVVSKIQRCENGMDLFAMMMGLKKSLAFTQTLKKLTNFQQNFHMYLVFS